MIESALDNLINMCNDQNPRDPSKSSLLHLILMNIILMNTPEKYVSTGVFSQDICDHCPVVMTSLLSSQRGTLKRNFKNFSEQAFLHDLYFSDLDYISTIPETDLALSLFADVFNTIVDNHAPFKNGRVKGRSNSWYTPELSEVIYKRDDAWVKARNTGLCPDWQAFKQLKTNQKG
jgi:hypothetical protein